jgi:predicted alpha/beta-fold hydrolase
MAARDLYEFDDIFTAPHGFAADDYYARASAAALHRIRFRPWCSTH